MGIGISIFSEDWSDFEDLTIFWVYVAFVVFFVVLITVLFVVFSIIAFTADKEGQHPHSQVSILIFIFGSSIGSLLCVDIIGVRSSQETSKELPRVIIQGWKINGTFMGKLGQEISLLNST